MAAQKFCHTPTVWRDGDKASSEDNSKAIGYLAFVQGLKQSQSIKELGWELIGLSNGQSVLDVGCGIGVDFPTLLNRIGSTGSIYGVDISHAMIKEATTLNPQPNVHLSVEDVTSHLSFKDNMFDSVFTFRTLQHVSSPLAAVKEMVRVTKVGGKVLMSEPDWDTVTLSSTDRKATRKYCRNFADSRIRNGWIGRELLQLAKHVGLANIQVVPTTFAIRDFATANALLSLTEISKEVLPLPQATKWIDEFKQKDEQGVFWFGVTSFLVVGEKQASTSH